MTSRVEHHPYILLGLVVGDGGAEPGGPIHTLLEVFDGDVEVHHHARLAVGRWPHRSDVIRLELKRQR